MGRDEVLKQLDVSRETVDRLDSYVALLAKWQKVQNLVAPSTLNHVWERHILDSAQLLPLVSKATWIADLGSGAGFPGLVLAILLANHAVRVDLVESNRRKAAFLSEVIASTGVAATVRATRIEDYVRAIGQGPDLITARALAPLDRLLDLCEGLLKTGSEAVFLKGQDVDQELTHAAKSWRIQCDSIPSLTDPVARILHVTSAERLAKRRNGQ